MAGIGRVAVGMARRGYDLQLTRSDEKVWRATVQSAARQALRQPVRESHRLMRRLMC